jgi:hypothetical protein
MFIAHPETAIDPMGIRALYPMVKRPELEVDHSPSSIN